MRGSRILLVIGTRPEAIKLAPVARALAALGARPSVLLTGQHPSLELAEHGFGNVEILELGCTAGPDPHAYVGQIVRRASMFPRRFELVIVQGDTSSALAGALAAAQSGIPVAHVEAGLRSHDLNNPWPEEEFRVAIDNCAQLLFAPSQLSAANLRRERVAGTIHVTGNTGIDAVLATAATLPRAGARAAGKPRLLVTCHRRESWGAGLASIASALRRIAETGLAAVDVILHPNPAVATAMRRLLRGSAGHGVRLRLPCGHAEMLQAMMACDLVLSDSGGMQEEAAALGVSLLVLRQTTERPEGIVSGNLALVGMGSDDIFDAVQRLLAHPAELHRMRLPSGVYGDGRASERIAAIIAEWFAERTEEHGDMESLPRFM